MNFYWPHLLWLLFAPAALLAWEVVRRQGAGANAHPKILRAEAGRHSLNLTPDASRLSPRHQARWWLAAGLVLAVVALARPQWGRIEEPVFGQSREILLALDLSRSMNSPDVRPSRLARAKLLIQSLLDRLQGERTGLVVFSGTAFLQSPLSADYEVLRQFLPTLDTNFLPEGGTNYGELLQTAIDSFSTDGSADRYLIILSDGEATDDDWRPLVDGLKKKNIRVIGLGVGTTDGTMIPDGTGGFVKDERGAVVLSKLESSTLRELAEKTGGTYADASTWVDLPALLDATIEAGHRGQFHESTRVHLAERFQWALAPALLCLLISFWREFPVRPRARDLRLDPGNRNQRSEGRGQKAENVSAGASVAALCLLTSAFFLLPSLCPKASAAENDTTVADSLTKVVGHLSAQDSANAHDWANLAQTTVTYGQRLQGTQQPVPAGPVRDALAAVDAGETLDANAADWSKLRRDLAALLKNSEEKKPPQQQQKQPQPQKNDSDQNQQDAQPKQSSGGKSPPDKSPQNKSQQSKGNNPEKNQQGSQQNPSSHGQSQQNPGPSAFGDMKENPPTPAQSQPQPSQARELQKFGGVPEKKAPDAAADDPLLAVPLQKLEQLKQQDSPAAIYQLLRGENKPAPASNGKNW
ncbi:MAG TPA: VWA domain-containing protein [Opitutaceae bacterium]|jgi:Ca-activated chloride channel family protein|nr:VWA domain-containing protein [Opitutaceae bacterium]